MTTQTAGKPNIEESYTAAVSSSNLRMDVREGSPTGAADLLTAAGWSPTRLGSALMRLHSEWDALEKPRRPEQSAINALALTVKDQQVNGKTVRGVVVVDGVTLSAQAWATKEAQGWYERELRILVGKLKTLPEVRRKTALRALKWGISNPIPISGAVVKYWLDQTCHACHGRKFKTIEGSPALSAKICHCCQGTGVSAIPGGEDGRRLVNYLDDCVSRARASIKKRLHVPRKVY